MLCISTLYFIFARTVADNRPSLCAEPGPHSLVASTET